MRCRAAPAAAASRVALRLRRRDSGWGRSCTAPCCCCCVWLDARLLGPCLLPSREEPSPVPCSPVALVAWLGPEGSCWEAGSGTADASSTLLAAPAAAPAACGCPSCRCCACRRPGLTKPTGRRSHQRRLGALAAAAAAASPPCFWAGSPPSAAATAAAHAASSLAVHRLCPSGITTTMGRRGGSAASSSAKLQGAGGREAAGRPNMQREAWRQQHAAACRHCSPANSPLLACMHSCGGSL